MATRSVPLDMPMSDIRAVPGSSFSFPFVGLSQCRG